MYGCYECRDDPPKVTLFLLLSKHVFFSLTLIIFINSTHVFYRFIHIYVQFTLFLVPIFCSGTTCKCIIFVVVVVVVIDIQMQHHQSTYYVWGDVKFKTYDFIFSFSCF